MKDRFKFRSFGRPNSIIEGMQNIYTFEETENGYANVKVEKGWLAFVAKENLKIMQCTGLKDRNGKLIFESDIVKLTGDGVDSIYIIKFGDFAMYDFDFQKDYEKDSTAVYGWYLGGHEYPVPLSISLETSELELEVIGNIYLDSHLLDKSNIL